jgi:hypothetical protein
MGLRSWWDSEKQRAEVRKKQAEFNAPEQIESQVPELAGKSEVEGMAYTLQQIDLWRSTASPEQWAEIQRRQSASIASFEAEGLIMPYWGNLWLLRNYQRELGLDVPWVAPEAKLRDD